MITGRQIRAARGLLDWDAADLAKKADMTRETIYRIESGRTQAQANSLERIAKSLVEAGVEFLPDDGVKRHVGKVDRLEGPEALYRFFDDVYDTVKEGGDLCVSGADERLFAEFNINEEAALRHRERMSAIKEKIKFRVLLKEGDTYFRNTSYIEYKWVQKDFFFEHPIYLYNNKLAFINFNKHNLEIFRIVMPAMAKAFRLQFDFIWSHAMTPTKQGDAK